jgi:S1-C subfamily serine protease
VPPGKLSPRMDFLDVLIVLLLVGATISGWRRGLTWVGLSFLGLLIGVILGAALAPSIAHRFGGHNPSTEALIGTGVFLGFVALIQGIGTAVGYRFRVAALRTDLAQVDSAFGSGLAAVGVLVIAWFLGLTFSQFGQFSQLSSEIQNSAILKTLDRVAPRPPAFLAQLSSLLRGEAFPNPFAGLSPGADFGSVTPATPADLQKPGILNAEQAVAKVLSGGDCGTEAGSAFPFSGELWATNAHVVAGGSDVRLLVPGHDQPFKATVVKFDPEVDIAVLDVPGTGVKPLNLADANPTPAAPGAVIGYPGGGVEKVVEAGVKGVESAEGRDIYGGNLVTRDIEVLQALVIPGNSGGPIVDLNGTVIGVVFAASTTNNSEGYALAPSTYLGELRASSNLKAPVDTGGCAN